MPQTAQTLRQLKDSRDRALLALETEQAQAATALLRQAKTRHVSESWGAFVDPLEWLKDDPSFGRRFGPLSHANDRLDGRDRPVIETEHDLAVIRGAARLLAESVPVAQGVLKNLTNYCIGTGFHYKAVARDADAAATAAAADKNAPAAANDRRLVAAVQATIDEFLETNDWVGDFERELFLRSRRDGEFFLALFPQPGGRAAARVIEPEQIAEPQNPRALEDWLGTETPSSWTFGIHTDAGDVNSVRGYHVIWDDAGNDWDYLSADVVEHAKLNVDRNVKRGISDFYAVRGHLEGVEKLLRNAREGAAIQAAIAFIREHVPGATQGQIQSLATGGAIASYTQPIKTGSRIRYISKYEPGTVLDVAQGMQYKPGPLGSAHAPNFIAIEQAVLRAIGVRWCMPEYMISGDASNANYASTMVAESPFVKACQAEQQFYKVRFRRILWKVLRLAARAGRFVHLNADFETLRGRVCLQIEAPAIAVRDQLSEAQTAELEHKHGILSLHTWAALAGRDYDTERKHLAAETRAETV